LDKSSPIERAFRGLARLVLGHRLLVALILAVLVCTLMLGLPHLFVDFSAKAFFGAQTDKLQAFESHRATWGTEDDVVLVASVTDEADGVLTKKRLDALEALRQALDALVVTEEVHGLTDAPRLQRAAMGMVLPVPLWATVPDGAEAVGLWQRGLLSDTLLVPQLLSEDGVAAGLWVRLEVPMDDIGAVQPAVEALQGVIAAHQGKAGLRHALAGIPAVRAGLVDAIVREQSFFFGLSLVLVAVLLWAFFRRLHAILVPMLAASLPLLMLFGTLGWTGEPIGLLNQVFTTLIPVIAIADAVHMVSRFHEERRRRGPPGSRLSSEDNTEAVIEAMAQVGGACLLTSVTTAVGFLSLGLASMPILRSFGVYAALGIGYAFLTVLFVVPMCLSFSNAPVRAVTQSAGLDRAFLVLARFTTRRWRAIVVGTVVVVALTVALGSRTVVDNQVTAVLDADHPTSVGNRLVDEALGGLMAVEVGLTGDLGDREALIAIQTAADRARQISEVRTVIDPASVLVGISQMLGGKPQIPDSQGAIDGLLGAAGDALAPLLDASRTHGRLIVRTEDVGANAYIPLEKQLKEALSPPLEAAGLSPVVTGTPLIAYAGINAITYDLRRSLATAFFVVALLIVFLFRSVRLGVISLLPNVFPLLIGYGLMGAIAWDLEPGPAVVFTIALGLAVDDTIHLLARYQEELRHRAHFEAIHEAVRRTGRAVFITTILLASGFAINLFSSFLQNRTYGGLGAVIILAALVADVLVLPALLAGFGGLAGDEREQSCGETEQGCL
jgi:predicted RND superfamily exporter protein